MLLDPSSPPAPGEHGAPRAARAADEGLFRAVIDSSSDGCMLFESVRDAAGRIVDFRWRYANAAAARIVGRELAWFPGRLLLVEMPGNRAEGLYDAYVHVVESGEPWSSELTYSHDGVDAFLRLQATRAGDGFAVTFNDLSARRRAEMRLRRLHEVTTRFAEAQTLVQVRQVMLDEIVDATEASGISLWLLTEDGLVLDTPPANTPGAAQRPAHLLLPLDRAHPAATVAAGGRPLFFADAQELQRAYPGLAGLREQPPVQANAHLPLTRGTELFAVLSLSFAKPSVWDDDRQAFALALATRAAVAYDRARLFEAERHARERAERLQAVIAALSAANTPEEVYKAVLHLGLGAMGGADEQGPLIARSGTLYIQNGELLELAGSTGAHADLAGRYQRMPLTSPVPAAEVFRTGQPIWLSSKRAFLEQYPHLAAEINLLDGDAAASLPVLFEGRILGGLNFTFPGPLAFNADQRAFLLTLADQAAQALERSRLFAVERETRRRLEQTMEREQRLREKAEETSRLKDEFLGTLSHELRTPLTAFLGYAQLLLSRKRDEAYVARTVERMMQSARAQAQLIEDLLDTSRIVSGKLRLELEPLDLVAVVHAALDNVRPALQAKALELKLELDPAASRVIGDGGRLQQVIWNLLVNAAKFTPIGGRVTVRLQAHDAEAVLSVSDTGQGIPAAFLPYVFDRFRQADSTSKRAHGGLGLGLAIVRHLVELHGGSAAATSAGPGRGATFTVRLPLVAGSAYLLSSDPAADDTTRPCPAELAGLRLLVVDDQPEIVALLEEIFADCGAVTRTAASAGEALDLLRRWRPDVLVSDIAMPGRDGYWLIEAVRALAPEEGGCVPAVALTAYVRVEDRLRTMAAGFNVYVPKPIEPAELREVVAELVRGSSARPPIEREASG
jgi:signal transduction histidine kinase/AmiR/NasT family two-component response regulator